MTTCSHMVCPFCQHDTNVYNSRLTGQRQQVWRRRRCNTCHRTFTTKERIDWTSVVKVISQEDSEPIPYSRDRLQLSIARACPSVLKQYGSVGEICDIIEQELQQSGFFTTSPQDAATITGHATSILRRYNPSFAVTYVQHVYRQDPPLDLLQELLSSS